MAQEIINEKKINSVLTKTKNPSFKMISDILSKAKKKKGLELEEVSFLVNLKTKEFEKELFKTAADIKNEIYGERLVFFAPLYVSDFCVNDCAYCNFHTKNKELKRTRLTLEELEEQVKILINMGHKRVLLEFGEDVVNNPIDYVIEVIKKIYSVKTSKGNIRRININIASTTTENYRKLQKENIGTYQLFQETYHRSTYENLHKGPKADYDRQITAHNRAYEAGIDDRGLGVLFGLYDWRFEVLSLVEHAKYMEKKHKVGPHTISVPRFCPAPSVTYNPEFSVSDKDFLKLIAILRLAVPYTGMIISTRESSKLRAIAFKIGISQTSAASVTCIGGYGKNIKNPQFVVHDNSTVEEVVKSALKEKLLPSFCTACYRIGRTGEDFMSLSKPGEIQKFCRPNAILTFAEYLEDFANKDLQQKGYKAIKFYLDKIGNKKTAQKTKEHLEEIKKGRRDIYF